MFASTVVTGEAGGCVLDEEEQLPVETAYGRSKQEGERLVPNPGCTSVIVRPGHVYGPGGWYEQEFVRRLRQPGRFAVIGRGDNWWDVVQAEDVASRSPTLSSARRMALSTTWRTTSRSRTTTSSKLTADALGVGRRGASPPPGAAGGGPRPVAAVVRSARTSNERVKRELDWKPRFPSAREGVPDAVARLQVAPAASAIAR